MRFLGLLLRVLRTLRFVPFSADLRFLVATFRLERLYFSVFFSAAVGERAGVLLYLCHRILCEGRPDTLLLKCTPLRFFTTPACASAAAAACT